MDRFFYSSLWQDWPSTSIWTKICWHSICRSPTNYPWYWMPNSMQFHSLSVSRCKIQDHITAWYIFAFIDNHIWIISKLYTLVIDFISNQYCEEKRNKSSNIYVSHCWDWRYIYFWFGFSFGNPNPRRDFATDEKNRMCCNYSACAVNVLQ